MFRKSSTKVQKPNSKVKASKGPKKNTRICSHHCSSPIWELNQESKHNIRTLIKSVPQLPAILGRHLLPPILIVSKLRGEDPPKNGKLQQDTQEGTILFPLFNTHSVIARMLVIVTVAVIVFMHWVHLTGLLIFQTAMQDCGRQKQRDL